MVLPNSYVETLIPNVIISGDMIFNSGSVVAYLCLTLCNPINYSLPGSSVHGIIQARILEWVAIYPLGDLPDPGIETPFPALAGGFFTTDATWKV